MISDTEIARVIALAAEIAADDDLTVSTDGEPETPELFGGLTPERRPDYNTYRDYIENRPIKWKD